MSNKETVIKTINIDRNTFEEDGHGRRYIKALDASQEASAATDELFRLLQEPCAGARLELAQSLGHPALCGIVGDLESSTAGRTFLGQGASDTLRWRQAVGVAVSFAMTQLGWDKTGNKGVVSNAHHFTRAEHFTNVAG